MASSLDRRVARVAGGATAVTLVGGGLVVGGGVTQAASFTATDEASLIQAINDANAAAGADTITISAVTIGLTAQLPKITDELTIVGAGQASTIIDGGDTYRGFYVLASASSVTVQDMTIQNTYYANFAGAIGAFGASLTVNDVTFSSNRVGGYGGAIAFVDNNVGGLSVTITGSSFDTNFADYHGGAVFVDANASTVSIIDSTFSYNYVLEQGGAVFLRDQYDVDATSVSIVDSTFTSNAANTAGAVYVDVYLPSSSMTIERSSFVQNESLGAGGGAVSFKGYGTVDIIDSTFDGNRAPNNGYGGALYLQGPAVTIERSNFANNQAYSGAGALEAYGLTSLTIRDSSFDGNEAVNGSGGAIYFSYLDDNSTFLIENSTFSNNVAGFAGGAIKAGAAGTDVVIDQSTFTGDTATYAGAVYANLSYYGTLEIRNTTISGNSADRSKGAVYTAGYNGSLSVVNSIISGNLDGADDSVVTSAGLSGPLFANRDDLGANFGGVYSSVTVDHSLIGLTPIDLTTAGSGNIESTDPVLGALADNGGRTLTMLPAEDSPAVDAGDSAVASFPTDQRARDRVYGAAIDIGAVEVQPDPVTTTTTVPETTTTTVPTTTVPVTTVPVTVPTTVPAVLPPTGGGERTGLLAALLTSVGAVLTFGVSRRRHPS